LATLSQSRAAYHNGFSIGGIQVELLGTSRDDVALVPSLASFQGRCKSCDIQISVERVASLPSAVRDVVFDSGASWRLYDAGDDLGFEFSAGRQGFVASRRLVVDSRFRRATLQMSDECFAAEGSPVASVAYPLDELLIMHRLTQESAVELHGVGVVGPNGANNLFIGHSGAGKSTTARLWTSLRNVRILSDDRIIVRTSPARDLQPGDDPSQIYMYGTPWHGEGCFALPERAPLSRIFVLEHGKGNVLTRLSKSQAVAELFARAFVPFHRHEYLEKALSFLEHLSASIPCYRFCFEPDARAVRRILDFHD